MTVKSRDYGSCDHHGIAPNQAHVVVNTSFTYASWDVYRPDGLWAKKVGTFSTEGAALRFCAENEWEVIR